MLACIPTGADAIQLRPCLYPIFSIYTPKLKAVVQDSYLIALRLSARRRFLSWWCCDYTPIYLFCKFMLYFDNIYCCKLRTRSKVSRCSLVFRSSSILGLLMLFSASCFVTRSTHFSLSMTISNSCWWSCLFQSLQDTHHILTQSSLQRWE